MQQAGLCHDEIGWIRRSGGKVTILWCDSISHCNKKVWTSPWLWMVTEIKLFDYLWFLDLTPLYFCLLSWMKREVYKRKVATWEELLASIPDAASHVKKWEKSKQMSNNAVFAHKLRRALRLVGFSNIHCELWQICHWNIKLKLKWN